MSIFTSLKPRVWKQGHQTVEVFTRIPVICDEYDNKTLERGSQNQYAIWRLKHPKVVMNSRSSARRLHHGMRGDAWHERWKSTENRATWHSVGRQTQMRATMILYPFWLKHISRNPTNIPCCDQLISHCYLHNHSCFGPEEVEVRTHWLLGERSSSRISTTPDVCDIRLATNSVMEPAASPRISPIRRRTLQLVACLRRPGHIDLVSCWLRAPQVHMP